MEDVDRPKSSLGLRRFLLVTFLWMMVVVVVVVMVMLVVVIACGWWASMWWHENVVWYAGVIGGWCFEEEVEPRSPD